jgi:dipeptidyl-peptidase-4
MMKRAIAFVAFLGVCLLICLRAEAAKKRLTVELVAHEGVLVSPRISSVQWRPGGQQISYLRRESTGKEAVTILWIYDVGKKEERALLDGKGENQKLNLPSYQWSPQGNSLLLEGQDGLWLLDVASGQKKRLTQGSEPAEYPSFSPTGDRVAFVKQDNLYVLDVAAASIKQLTRDGNENVLNGKLDWVYEEELANRAGGRSFEWSPDGKKIAYLRLDDTPVPLYPLTDYLSVHALLTRQRFPQPGDPNPVPSFHVVSVRDGAQQSWKPKATSPHVEYFGPTFSWTADSQALSFLTLNRAQNELRVHLWDLASDSDHELLAEKDTYWINSLVPPRFLEDDQRFLWLSERDGWLHLYLYNRQGELLNQLTHGTWQIDPGSIGDTPSLGVDAKGGWVYFQATEKDPCERQLYRVRLDGTGFERLSRESGTHALNLSPSGGYLIDTFSNIDEPPSIRLLKADGSFVAPLDQPKNRLGEYALAKTEFVEVTAVDGARLFARLVKPADFDARKKYPVVVNVYGGPHAQVVADRWGATSLFDHLLAQEGFLVWSLDNRGSAGRGHAWEFPIFNNLGRRELDDQLAGVVYLKSLPFVDANRLGIWGWSYGGFMTLYALTHAPDVFRCGAAGGPVTDWKLYDSIYTERYMRTPTENPEGYRASSPVEAADKLKAALLLIHGTDDDNVHMQNTLSLVSALVKARRPFELYLQPGQKHGFAGETVRAYLYDRLLDFFKKNLNP